MIEIMTPGHKSAFKEPAESPKNKIVKLRKFKYSTYPVIFLVVLSRG
jgi:hypothetical protein